MLSSTLKRDHQQQQEQQQQQQELGRTTFAAAGAPTTEELNNQCYYHTTTKYNASAVPYNSYRTTTHNPKYQSDPSPPLPPSCAVLVVIVASPGFWTGFWKCFFSCTTLLLLSRKFVPVTTERKEKKPRMSFPCPPSQKKNQGNIEGISIKQGERGHE